MSYLPGTPCYSHGTVVYPRGCGIDPCHVHKTGTDLVFYNGANLPCVGVDTCDSVTLAFQKIDQKLCPDALALAVLGSITNNLSIRNMFCALVNGCNPTTTTTTTAAPTTTTTTSSSSSTTTTSTSSSSTTTTTTTISDDCNCYTIENDETESGVDPYFYSYIDCISGLELSVPLDFGQSDNFCGRAIGITTNFLYTLTNYGICGLDCPPTTTTSTSSTSTSSTTSTTTTATPTTTTTTTLPCTEYNLNNPTLTTLSYSYVSCVGVDTSGNVLAGDCVDFFAATGTVLFDDGLILGEGACF
jgi:hypothetical protein